MIESVDVVETVKTWLEGRGYHVDLDGGWIVSFTAAKGECLVEVDPAGRVRCQFGIDLDELRDLIAGSATEDLGDDELQRAARYHLQTVSQRYQRPFLTSGFAEEYDVTADHAVISFSHLVDYTKPDTVVAVLSQCIDILK